MATIIAVDNNVGVVIPPGVAHAIRVEGAEDVIMVYGTSTIFHPEFEGRIASDVESAALPESWQKFLSMSETSKTQERSCVILLPDPQSFLNEAKLRSGRSGNDGSAATGFAELERDLERIRQLNRWFGSYRLVSTFMRRWISPARKCALSILPRDLAIFRD